VACIPTSLIAFISLPVMNNLSATQEETIPDACDYKGHPAQRSKTGGWVAAAMILGLQYI